jgi:hypothetical protein
MRIFSLLMICLLSLSASQLAAQHAAGYDNVRQWTNFAEFSVANAERKIVEEQGVTFAAEAEVQLSFEVLVNPQGTVDFVRIPRCTSDLHAYRKGGADALYGFQFEPQASAKEAEWVTVHMTVQPER